MCVRVCARMRACLRDVFAIYDNTISPRLIMIIIKMSILYFIQIRQSDDFTSTDTRLVLTYIYMHVCMHTHAFIHTCVNVRMHAYIIHAYIRNNSSILDHSAILDRWSNIAYRQWSNIPEPSVDLQRCGSCECDIFSRQLRL